jgi:hypothetical protein
MLLLLLCLLNLSGNSGQAMEINPTIQAEVHHAFLMAEDNASADVSDDGHQSLTYGCAQDPECIDQKIAKAIKNRRPDLTVKFVSVFAVPYSTNKDSWVGNLQTGERRFAFKINGFKLHSHQVIEIKSPSSPETAYIFDPIHLSKQTIVSRDEWEKMITSPFRVIYKSTEY